MTSLPFLTELRWRGLLHQTTAKEDQVATHLQTPGRVGYCGFDPTKDSLTIGHLIPIMMLMHWQRAGHQPIVLMGGGTGLIGDPSFKDAERPLLDRDQVAANIAGQRRVFERFLDFGGASKTRGLVVNNADWLEKLSFIDVLRDVGKHFSVNAMIQRDAVRMRLEQREQGISYTEFSYMLLQAYDFLYLKQTLGCSVQISGSDQFGNVVGGVDLIHHKLGREGEAGEAYGITAPLVTRADGKKIGKTETGAVWLTADRTSPYALYQYLINTEDSDVVRFLRWFTLLDQGTVADLEAQHLSAPHERRAQRVLAEQVTTQVHGAHELARVQAASQALFGGDVRTLDEAMLAEVFSDVPHTEHDKARLAADGLPLVDLLAQTSLAASKSQARQFVESGAVSVNGERADLTRRLSASDLLHGSRILLRRGKKQWHATHWR